MKQIILFALRLIAKLPFSVLYGISNLLAQFAFYVIRYRRKVVSSNLHYSFPDKNQQELYQIAKEFYYNLADVIIETIKTFSITRHEVQKRVRIINPELPLRYLSEGKPIIAMTSHQSNWEWVLMGASALNYPLEAVYKPLRNPIFNQVMIEIRSIFGATPVPMQSILREIVRRKSEPRLIGMVADQMPFPEHAYWTTFLNQDTGFYTGSEKIARNIGYVVLFIEVVRVKRGHYEMRFEELAVPPYDTLAPNSIIEKYAKRLEKSITQYPADWLWSHKRWKHQRPTG